MTLTDLLDAVKAAPPDELESWELDLEAALTIVHKLQAKHAPALLAPEPAGDMTADDVAVRREYERLHLSKRITCSVDPNTRHIEDLKRQVRNLEDLVEALLISAPAHTLYVSDIARVKVRDGGAIGVTRYDHDRQTAYWWWSDATKR